MPTVSTEVFVRNNMGRFMADVRGAATQVVEDALDAGVAEARAHAPARTGRLRASFVPVILSRTSGLFMNTAPYALYQDEGAGPHPLPANVTFWWDKMGRMWMPPDVYRRVTGFPGADPINHPGNPGTHFMDAGYRAAVRAAERAVARYYP